MIGYVVELKELDIVFFGKEKIRNCMFTAFKCFEDCHRDIHFILKGQT